MRLESGYFDELNHTFIECDFWIGRDGKHLHYFRIGNIEFSFASDFNYCTFGIGIIHVNKWGHLEHGTILDLVFQ